MSRKNRRREGKWWGARQETQSDTRLRGLEAISDSITVPSNRVSRDEGGRFMSGYASSSDTFTCNVDGVSACSKAPNSNVLADSRLWQSIIGLCERFDTEWMAYMVGRKLEDGNYIIDRLDFPEQTAGGAHVRNEMSGDFHTDPATIGVVHSHVGMQAFFSPTDKAHANWPVEIVINRRGEYEVSMRVQLPCGDFMRRSAKVYLLTGGQLDKMEETLKAALEKGEAREQAKRPVSVVWSSGGHGGSYGGAFRAANQGPSPRYPLGGKYMTCPICALPATGDGCCSHSLHEMETYEKRQDTPKGGGTVSETLVETTYFSLTKFYGGEDRKTCIQITDDRGQYCQIPRRELNKLILELAKIAGGKP